MLTLQIKFTESRLTLNLNLLNIVTLFSTIDFNTDCAMISVVSLSKSISARKYLDDILLMNIILMILNRALYMFNTRNKSRLIHH